MRPVKLICIGLASACLAALSGCVSYPIVGGNPSTLTGEALALRTTAINAAPLRRKPSYQPVKACRYQQEIYFGGSLRDSSVAKAETKAVRNRLLITWKEANGEPSTAIIGHDGALFDFNFYSPIDGDRWTSENFKKKSAEQRAEYGARSRTINGVERLYPKWSAAQGVQPGATLAVVHDDAGGVWGEYVYRGTATIKGNSGVLADLVRRSSIDGGTYTYGFSVFDEATFAPLVAVLSTGATGTNQVSAVHQWRIGCP